MKRILVASAALTAILWTAPAFAAEKLIISSWGGSWKELIEQTVAKKFKADNRRRCRIRHRRNHRPAEQGQARQRQPGKRRDLHDVACRMALRQ